MTKWKLRRQTYGDEEFTITEGDDVTIGRALTNTITLSSIVISRNHCVLKVQDNEVLITDLKSSNGVYIGSEKIPPNKPCVVKDSDIIGIGWISDAALAEIKDEEKFVFKLCKEKSTPAILNRIKFQSENEIDIIEQHLVALHCDAKMLPKVESPIIGSKLSLKRKVQDIKTEIKKEKKSRIITVDDEVVNLLSDSENEVPINHVDIVNNVKLEVINEEPLKNKIKCENEFVDCEAYNVKQEYFGYDDEPIKVDSDSDSESEHWYLRLSQSSPGKPFIRKSQDKIDTKQDDSSYSQMDDDFISFIEKNEVEEEYLDDIITIPDTPKQKEKALSDEDDFQDIISLNAALPIRNVEAQYKLIENRDEVDACGSDLVSPKVDKVQSHQVQTDLSKKVQLIDPLVSHKSNSKHETHKKPKCASKLSKVKKHSSHSSSKKLTNSQKEERRKRLKEIAIKGKEIEDLSNNIIKSTANINKISNSNRGGFLTDTVQVVKPVRKDDTKKTKSRCRSSKSPPKCETKYKTDVIKSPDLENSAKFLTLSSKDGQISSDTATKDKNSKSSHNTSHDSKSKVNERREAPIKSLRPEVVTDNSSKKPDKAEEISKIQETRVPLKCVKPVTESDETNSDKPFSKVEPLPPRKKKTVRFSDAAPQIRIFEIEPGNKMKKTSLVKTSLVDSRQLPVFSLEKITLMRILRWNPHWLEEQLNNNEPPPILGHNNPPMSTFHSYVNHHQYVQLVGDLLLMEIWECLSLAYLKIRNQNMGLQMQVGPLPPPPTQERCYELYSLSVNISVPSNNKGIVPRTGEIILALFGPENAKTKRFFFVNNVRTLPSPPNNIHTFYCISLHTTFTDKMRALRQGEVIVGATLAHINNELNLFEAMEHLAGSPLSEAILRPEPRHFPRHCLYGNEVRSEWTKTLNPSQQLAVTCSVSAALSDLPSIQMVQGPPGTGKSSVICAMVMTYFYGEQGRRQQNRGKVLICATSNAAVDELVIRLLKIRQNLPKVERFKMVRVGRLEAMHSRARDVSSQQLAQRDAVTRVHAEPQSHPGLIEEISHLEAKINMWKTAAHDAKDPVRVAYCQGRVSDLVKRITLMKSGASGKLGDGPRPDEIMAAEKRIIEGAHIVLTTLASAHNTKLKALKRRIALCIIDEAGQAIEPVTLIPLTLDVTRLTLIGDPQQLPGYICSQRAKKHGLGESLFSRLTSSAEDWPQGSPVILLNQQYRMHPDIADYPNRAFYGGRVITSAPERPFNLALPPYAIISISSGDKGQGSSGANSMEAWGVSRLVTALNATLKTHSLNLAVITPYNAHKELIKKHLKTLQDPSEPAVEVNTVDSFQGQERDVVVVSLARSQGVGFLTDAGRMNVMLTRAKHALLICLNPHAMLRNPQWRTLVEDAQRRNMYRVLPNKMCQPALTGASPEDILKYLHT